MTTPGTCWRPIARPASWLAACATSCTSRLYEAAGCVPMALGPGSLPALTNLFHGERTLVMRCIAHGVRADLAPEVEQLHAFLLQAQALQLLARDCIPEAVPRHGASVVGW
jgi:hypothetical protein